tara:strand:+ start:284 stop:682 length:399 start_codon:yes stop_codon:yes gene_type:complete
MNTKRKVSIALLIKRFFAVFVFISIVFGIVDDFLSGNITGDTVNGAVVGLIIVYFLSRTPKSLNQSKNNDETIDVIEEDKEIYDEETLKEFETFEDQYENIDKVRVNKNSYSPVKDGENLLIRIFKGRTDRY